MKNAIVIALLLPFAVGAQITFPQITLSQITVSGTNASVETPLGAALDLGKVATGDVLSARLRVRNTGSSAVTITQFAANGTGFSVNAPSVPFPLAPGNAQDILLSFTASVPATYSANLLLTSNANNVGVIVLATAVPGPVFTVSPACTSSSSPPLSVDFGSAQAGQFRVCSFTLQNSGTEDMTIEKFQVTGSGFQVSTGPPPPFKIPPGGTVAFGITFAPNATGFYTGALSIETRTYILTGAAFATPLPAPLLEFDSGSIQSAQQRRLTMRLATAASASVSGSVNLAFLPDTTLLSDDPAIVFLATGTRSLPFSISQGSTQIAINGQTSAMFQTGTSSGRIRFTISGVSTDGDATTLLTIPASAIALDTAIATRRSGDLDVQLIGFDNTYSAGSMAFTFFDTAGKALASAINADFTKEFRTFFSQAKSGSAFQVRVSFPVTGDPSGIGSVDVRLSNSTTVTTQHLVFQ